MRPELLQNALLQKGAKLGHFFLCQGRPEDRAAQKEWVLQFIRRYWSEVEKRPALPTQLREDADLLWLAPPHDGEKTSDYKVEDLEELWRFLPYRGLKAQRRFVVLEETHRIGPLLVNKLLKTMEEPEGSLSFFWLNPRGAKLLPTLESRAQVLSLTWPKPITSPGPLLQELRPQLAEGYALAQFLDDAKSGKFAAEELLLEFLAYEELHDGPARLKQELLNLTRDWNMANRFHQPIAPRLQALHLLLTERFQNR